MDWLLVHIYQLRNYDNRLTPCYEYRCKTHPEWMGHDRGLLSSHIYLDHSNDGELWWGRIISDAEYAAREALINGFVAG